MKNRLFITVVVVFFALSSPISRSIENRAIINPAGLSTVPPSSIQSGLINNPNPIDTSGNLIITGNVRRGRHFRDTVPYQPTTNFRAGLGSSSLSSFLRDSAGVEDFGRYTGKYRTQPYYSRSQTVTTTLPGRSGVFRPTSTRINNRTPQGQFSAGMYRTGPEKQALPSIGTPVPDSGLPGPQTPLEITSHSELSGFQRRFLTGQTQYSKSAEPRIVHSIRELQLLNQREVGIRQQDQQLAVERHQQHTQGPGPQTQDSEFKTQKTSLIFEPGSAVPGIEREQSSTEKYDTFKLFGQSRVAERVEPAEVGLGWDEPVQAQADAAIRRLTLQDELRSWEHERQADETKSGENDRNLQSSSDILEQVRQQLADLMKSVNETQLSKTSLWVPARRGPSQTRQVKDARQDTKTFLGQQKLSSNKTLFSTEQSIQPLDELKGLSQAELSAMAKRIRGPYTSSESYSEAKFNRHIQAAQGHLKAGRYYAAADSFTLASIYKQDEPLCLAGRGHALFAAGEYISSALFLSRALETAPEYARIKIDLAAMLGGQNKLDGRIADIKEWLERSGSGRLEFLLGYVYYRMGRLNQAKQAIEAAYTKMPQSPAVAAVKKAIDDAIAGQ